MIKVLILAYDFYPLPSAGAQRPYSWYKYLHEFDVCPVVVTRHWDEDSGGITGFVKPSRSKETEISVEEGGTIIRVPYSPNLRDRIILKFGENKWVLLRKTISFLLSFLKFYFRRLDNTNAILQAANAYLSSNKADLIIATGEPFILFRHAWYLSREYKVPYILDYRDGWTHGLNLEPTSKTYKKISKFLFLNMERKFLKSARSVTVAANGLVPKLKFIYSDQNFTEILNGYFEESFENRKPLEGAQKLTFIYSGRLYNSQPLEDFMDTLVKVSELYSDVETEIIFIGGIHDVSVQRRIQKYLPGKTVNIKLLPRLKYDVYVEMLYSAHVLLLLSADTGGIMNAKLFDYLPSGKRILLFRSDRDVVEKIITECRAGFIFNNCEDLFSGLSLIFAQFRDNGEINGITENYSRFTRKNQVRKLAQHIKSCVE